MPETPDLCPLESPGGGPRGVPSWRPENGWAFESWQVPLHCAKLDRKDAPKPVLVAVARASVHVCKISSMRGEGGTESGREGTRRGRRRREVRGSDKHDASLCPQRRPQHRTAAERKATGPPEVSRAMARPRVHDRGCHQLRSPSRVVEVTLGGICACVHTLRGAEATGAKIRMYDAKKRSEAWKYI